MAARFQRELSTSSMSSLEAPEPRRPPVDLAQATGHDSSMNGRDDQHTDDTLSRQASKLSRDWLSPPASPSPDSHPFYTELDVKHSQLAESKFYATHPPEEHTQLLQGTGSTVMAMPDLSTLMATSPPQQLVTSSAPATAPIAAGEAIGSRPSRSRSTSLGKGAVGPGSPRKPTGLPTFTAVEIPPSQSGTSSPNEREQRRSTPSRSPSRAAMPSGVPNFRYRDAVDRPTFDRTRLDPNDDEEIELEVNTGDGAISSELQELYASFQTCIELREKYLRYSCQRLEDNPINYDGRFAPSNNSTSTSASHPPSPERATPASTPQVTSPPPLAGSSRGESSSRPRENGILSAGPASFKPWKIYPPPPRPHWEAVDPAANAWSSAEPAQSGPYEFRFDDCEIPGSHPFSFDLDSQGVYQVYADEKTERKPENTVYTVPTLKEYFLDLEYILGVISDGPAKSFAYRRIKYLESRWNLYCLLNEYQELAEMKRVPHRDFYNVRKVDTHVHHSACMNQKHLLRFIKSKMRKSPNDIVTFRDGRNLTLKEVFESLRLTAYDLSIDTLDMHAHRDSFHRFDRFNTKYNPIGETRLREIFLKTDNLIQGRYLAEVTQEVFEDLRATKYQMAEYRISIYGRSRGEWDKLAKWVVNNKLFSDNVRWLIQIPRLYEVFKASKTVESFGDVIRNIFQPLFEVTQDPRTHPELHVFLQRVVGFDSVDDESKPERRLYRKYPFPKDWTTSQNPPYTYWLFYLFVNMSTLNNWRKERGFNTFVLRPHAGEAGDTDHLTSAFLTSHSISHGILLRKVPALCYLFYLEQIGVAMSPLSNNALFLTYERNPFPQYFKLGLNVSLSTDDPLQLHYTKEPLMEEYSVAAQIYKLSPADMCELARNSVIQSGFEMEIKRHWLGQDWYLPGAEGNVVDKTNVPNVRVAFRYNTLMEERTMIRRYSNKYQGTKTPPLQTLQTRPDLFPASRAHDAVQGKDGNVASLAMGTTAMPNIESMKLNS